MNPGHRNMYFSRDVTFSFLRDFLLRIMPPPHTCRGTEIVRKPSGRIPTSLLAHGSCARTQYCIALARVPTDAIVTRRAPIIVIIIIIIRWIEYSCRTSFFSRDGTRNLGKEGRETPSTVMYTFRVRYRRRVPIRDGRRRKYYCRLRTRVSVSKRIKRDRATSTRILCTTFIATDYGRSSARSR